MLVCTLCALLTLLALAPSCSLIVFNASLATSEDDRLRLDISNPRESDIVYRPCCSIDIIASRRAGGQEGFGTLASGSKVCSLAVHLLRLPTALLSSSYHPYQRIKEELEPLARECLMESLELERGILPVASANQSMVDHLWLRKRPHFIAPTLEEINYPLQRPRCAALVEKGRKITRDVLLPPSDNMSLEKREALLNSVIVDVISEGRRGMCNTVDEMHRVLMLQMQDERYQSGIVSLVATVVPPVRKPIARRRPVSLNSDGDDADLGPFHPNKGYEATLRTFTLIRPPSPLVWSPHVGLGSFEGQTVVLNTEGDARRLLALARSYNNEQQNKPRNAYATLVYSDDYMKGVITLATTLAASLREESTGAVSASRAEGGEPATLVVMIGCKPTGANEGMASNTTLNSLLSYIHWDDEAHLEVGSAPRCVPMVSDGWLTKLRSRGARLLLLSNSSSDNLLRDVTTALKRGTGQVDAEGSDGQISHRSTAPRAPSLRIRPVFVPYLPNLRPGVSIIGLDSGVWMKLHSWALESSYDCLVLLDADLLINKPLDHLFDLPLCSPSHQNDGAPSNSVAGVSVEHSDLEAGLFNVGMMVIKPSIEVWRDMLGKHLMMTTKPTATPPSFQVVETTFLNHYFGNSGWDRSNNNTRRSALILPLNYWCIAETIARYDKPWLCNTVDFSSCGNARFKPWQDREPPSDPMEVCRGESPPSQEYLRMVKAWRDVYALAMTSSDERMK
jgi:hypothetical protein